MDIAVDKSSECKQGTDPTKYHSERSGRGPLTRDWIDVTQPVMCCYKLASIDIKLGWITSTAESMIEKVVLSSNKSINLLNCFYFVATIFDAFRVCKKNIFSH